MKKIILCTLCVVSTTLLTAQPTLKDKVTRVVAQHTRTWQQQLTHIQAQFAHSAKTAPSALTYVLMDKEINPFNNQTYQTRLAALQQNMHMHPALKSYQFATPVPADLANLSYDNYEALAAFLANAPTAQVTKTERVYPFTLSLHIKGVCAGEVELWIDEPTKKVYLMSDNFYTTAAGKYGPRCN